MVWIALVLTLLSGWLLANALVPVRSPAWGWILRQVGLGVFFGPGAASLLLFALLAARRISQVSVGIALASLAAGSLVLYIRRRWPESNAAADARFLWKAPLLLAIAVASVAFLVRFTVISNSVPDGDYDGFAIWNQRASYLASGEPISRRALGADADGSLIFVVRPTYPLYLSGFLASAWAFAGDLNPALACVASGLFGLAAVALLAGGLVWTRSPTLAAVASLILLTSRDFVTQSAWQYSDIPLALGILAALVLLEQADGDRLERRLLLASGFAIGLLPWIKNEGWVVALAALVCAGWRFGRQSLPWLGLGALPGIAATLWLRTMTTGVERYLPGSLGEALGLAVQPERWSLILLRTLRDLAGTGTIWAHPILLVAILMVVLGFVKRDDRCKRYWLGIPIVVLLAADFALLLIAPVDLPYYLQNTMSRLLVQVWPALIWLAFLFLRRPEDRATSSGRGGAET